MVVRVRCSSSMAGWSMVADEEDAVDFGKTPKNLEPNHYPDSTGSGFEKKIAELVSLFRRLLESFLVEFCSADSLRPLPPVTGDGLPVDLFSLFLNVSHRGGFVDVSSNGLWDEVAQECGLGLNNSGNAKLIYVKYLDSLARWLKIVIAGDDDDGAATVDSSGISDDLLGKLKDFLSQVKMKYELRKGNAAMEIGAELKWFISKTKRRYDKFQIGKEIQGSRLMILDDAGNKESSTPGKRKRECPLATFKWLSEAAKDPCDPSIGRLPDRAKWEFYGSEEPWKLLLLFRASRTKTDPACEKTWQRIQKMHPCLYEDSVGPGYNLRERFSFDGKKGFGNGSYDDWDRPCGQVGPEFQAEIPEWTGITTESDSKWLGDQIWPPLSKDNNSTNILIERDPIGQGRQDPCGCPNPGSVDCVRFHITKKQEKLILELGSTFYMWCFDTMGEGSLQYWTDSELKKMKSLMVTPPTLSPSFFEEMKKIFPLKSRANIVSYYYNVTLLRYRGNQNRIAPDEADSDTDQFYLPKVIQDATPEANTSQKHGLISPKKRRR